MNHIVQVALDRFTGDRTRLMDMLHQIQDEMGYIPDEAVLQLAHQLNVSSVDVRQTLSFYHFFAANPRGKYTVYLNNSVVAWMMGRELVAKTFEQETGCRFGSVTDDGLIGLFDTSDIGMNDQEPAALINGIAFTRLTPYRVKELVKDMRAGKAVREMFHEPPGDGQNSSGLVQAMVGNNIRREGLLLSRDARPGDALKKIVEMTPEQVIKEISESNLRGRGGAGFPTGMKWDFCRKSKEEERYVLCNADEGEPGTFKDRVLLTEYSHFVFEGMTVAGYAIGSRQGILYLRYEYKYLLDFLNSTLAGLRSRNLLGKDIAGRKGFNFDIRIQLGAGAYVCGEESALIESAEGKRGEPRDRPPFPVESGYLNKPTIVNNVETLLAAVRIIHHGAAWFKSFGTIDSAGTKVLSVSGDCRHPGIYEVPWGFAISDILDMCGATDVQAVQVGGPSGTLIGPGDFDRMLSFADLATGGSFIIIGNKRDLLKDVVLNFMDFFIEESCGSCSTCRNFPVVMRRTLVRIIEGKGIRKDISDLLEWGQMPRISRCGLGQTCANPILTSIRNFRQLYESKLMKDADFVSEFDMAASVKDACDYVGRIPGIQ
ncbi:MAG TPA: NAD(P)H-dependent oxidoreductase subunit E [Bacteroidales bacterium]|nr:NAD(P)H-dependent oxidoreductase subunit E [Bacteroidales bacterium]